MPNNSPREVYLNPKIQTDLLQFARNAIDMAASTRCTTDRDKGIILAIDALIKYLSGDIVVQMGSEQVIKMDEG